MYLWDGSWNKMKHNRQILWIIITFSDDFRWFFLKLVDFIARSKWVLKANHFRVAKFQKRLAKLCQKELKCILKCDLFARCKILRIIWNQHISISIMFDWILFVFQALILTSSGPCTSRTTSPTSWPTAPASALTRMTVTLHLLPQQQ